TPIPPDGHAPHGRPPGLPEIPVQEPAMLAAWRVLLLAAIGGRGSGPANVVKHAMDGAVFAFAPILAALQHDRVIRKHSGRSGTIQEGANTLAKECIMRNPAV